MTILTDEGWVKPWADGSWHLVAEAPANDSEGVTLCGRIIPRDVEIHSNWTGNERTCESCLRISAS